MSNLPAQCLEGYNRVKVRSIPSFYFVEAVHVKLREEMKAGSYEDEDEEQ